MAGAAPAYGEAPTLSLALMRGGKQSLLTNGIPGATYDRSELMRQMEDRERRLTMLRDDVRRRGDEGLGLGSGADALSSASPVQTSDQSLEARIEALQRDMDGLKELFMSTNSPTLPPSYA